ncbi:hypothetical protein B296_00040765 [Ensete ventricosum]|uniref:Uncharacterized protein n=1 Tax=Ensete ventricosum TaxID=4639 RepID=A0A426ZBV5_ENSVE|nr:hypothetical protein B296_00040765 [Ensete ventricosum]
MTYVPCAVVFGSGFVIPYVPCRSVQAICTGPIEDRYDWLKVNMLFLANFLQTSYAMANALNVLQTSHSFGDMMLSARVAELTKVKITA